jgi:hypothetical protein
MHLARSMSYPSCRNCTVRAQGGSFEGVDSTAAGEEGQVGVLMTGTRPAKMDQNLSNDVQDKTADISGSGRKRLHGGIGLIVRCQGPSGSGVTYLERCSLWLNLAACPCPVLVLTTDFLLP